MTELTASTSEISACVWVWGNVDTALTRTYRETPPTDTREPSDVADRPSPCQVSDSGNLRVHHEPENGRDTPDPVDFAWPREFLQTGTDTGIVAFASVVTDYATDFSDTIYMRRTLETRIEDLKRIADDEGIEVSNDSERDLWLFLNSVRFTRRPYIVLLDNGNFRAIWKNADHEQIGLQFRGAHQIQYVLFALRPPDGFMAQAAGRDILDNVGRQIDACDLWRLLKR